MVEVQGVFRSAYRKRDESEDKRNHLYNMHKTCNVVWQWDMANKDRGYKENTEEWNKDVEMDGRSEFKWKESNECVRNMLAIDDIAEIMRRNRLRWFGHVERDELCWIKRIETLQVDGDGVKR